MLQRNFWLLFQKGGEGFELFSNQIQNDFDTLLNKHRLKSKNNLSIK